MNEHLGYEPVRVHIVNTATPARKCRRAWKANTFILTSAQATQRVLPRSDKRAEAWITSAVSEGAPTVTTPAVPASTVAAQNPNNFPIQVVITGGTLTAVVVNGVTVGTAAGTYFVPAYGAISVTYSAAPTWTWTAAAPFPVPIVYVADNQAGAAAQGGGSAQVSGADTTPFPVNTSDEVWVSTAGPYPVTVSVVAFYEQDD